MVVNVDQIGVVAMEDREQNVSASGLAPAQLRVRRGAQVQVVNAPLSQQPVRVANVTPLTLSRGMHPRLVGVVNARAHARA